MHAATLQRLKAAIITSMVLGLTACASPVSVRAPTTPTSAVVSSSLPPNPSRPLRPLKTQPRWPLSTPAHFWQHWGCWTRPRRRRARTFSRHSDDWWQ